NSYLDVYNRIQLRNILEMYDGKIIHMRKTKQNHFNCFKVAVAPSHSRSPLFTSEKQMENISDASASNIRIPSIFCQTKNKGKSKGDSLSPLPSPSLPLSLFLPPSLSPSLPLSFSSLLFLPFSLSSLLALSLSLFPLSLSPSPSLPLS